MNYKLLNFLSLISISFCVYPLAIFHGINDFCGSTHNMELVEYLGRDLGVYVECIEVVSGAFNSIFKPMSYQVEDACNIIKSNPNFQKKFNVMGISQGTLIGRYIIEKCQMKGKVMRYLSLNGPQMGIGWIPKLTCGTFCDMIVNITAPLGYKLTGFIAPTSYLRFRYDQEYYEQHNVFLKELNNENEIKDEEVYNRFSSLEKVMLVKSKNDTVITPIESSWFEFWDKEGKEIVPLRESQFYKEDFIGLRKLDEEGKVSFVEFGGEHVMYNIVEYFEGIMPFFRD